MPKSSIIFLQALLKRSTDVQEKNLLSSYEYLCSPKKMGEKFKVMAIARSNDPKPPAY